MASEDCITDVLARHRERVASLEQLGKAERALGEELQRTLSAQPTARTGLLGRLLRGKAKTEAPLLQTLWERHEQAMEKVRALGHHVEALDRDLALLQADVERLGDEACAAAHKRDASEKALPEALSAQARAESDVAQTTGVAAIEAGRALDRAKARAWDLRQEVERSQAVEERTLGLLEVLRETRGTMERLHASLGQLHDAGTRALADLERRLSILAAGATARDLALQTVGAMDALRETLHVVSNLADENATFLDERVDALDARMRLLDAQSETEREARDEVEAALRRSTPR